MGRAKGVPSYLCALDSVYFPGLFPNLVPLCLTLFLSFHGSFPSKSLLGRCYSGRFNFELGFADLKVQVEVVRIADKQSSTEPTL